MEPELIRQYHLQYCSLHAKAFYLVNFINLFTEGYADLRVTKNHRSVEYFFSKKKSSWESRFNDVTGEIVQEHCFLPDLSKPKHKDEIRYNREWSDHLKRMKEFIRVLEKFIAEKDIDFENDLSWTNETIRFKVYSLNY